MHLNLCLAKHFGHRSPVLYKILGHRLHDLSSDFITEYSSLLFSNLGTAATAAIASYVISEPSIVEFGPDIDFISFSYILSGISNICDVADIASSVCDLLWVAAYT